MEIAINSIICRAGEYMSSGNYDSARSMYRFAQKMAKGSHSSAIRTIYKTTILPALRQLEEEYRPACGCYSFEGGVSMHE